MPSVNRQSLREELDTLKGQFERLSATGKVGAEIGALVQALLMLLDLVMAIFMEKTTTTPAAQENGPILARENGPSSRAPWYRQFGVRRGDCLGMELAFGRCCRGVVRTDTEV